MRENSPIVSRSPSSGNDWPTRPPPDRITSAPLAGVANHKQVLVVHARLRDRAHALRFAPLALADRVCADQAPRPDGHRWPSHRDPSGDEAGLLVSLRAFWENDRLNATFSPA